MPMESRNFSVESWSALEKRIFMMLIGASTEANINWRLNLHSRKFQISEFFNVFDKFFLLCWLEYLNKSLGNIILVRGKTIKEFKIENLNQPVST
jgi:hypothetical protein